MSTCTDSLCAQKLGSLALGVCLLITLFSLGLLCSVIYSSHLTSRSATLASLGAQLNVSEQALACSTQLLTRQRTVLIQHQHTLSRLAGKVSASEQAQTLLQCALGSKHTVLLQHQHTLSRLAAKLSTCEQAQSSSTAYLQALQVHSELRKRPCAELGWAKPCLLRRLSWSLQALCWARLCVLLGSRSSTPAARTPRRNRAQPSCRHSQPALLHNLTCTG